MHQGKNTETDTFCEGRRRQSPRGEDSRVIERAVRVDNAFGPRRGAGSIDKKSRLILVYRRQRRVLRHRRFERGQLGENRAPGASLLRGQ